MGRLFEFDRAPPPDFCTNTERRTTQTSLTGCKFFKPTEVSNPVGVDIILFVFPFRVPSLEDKEVSSFKGGERLW